MNKERRFYIAYEICKFLNNREPNNRRFKDYEVAMYTAELAEAIEYAEEKQDKEILKQYYNILEEELKEVQLLNDTEEVNKVKRLIELLNEWE